MCCIQIILENIIFGFTLIIIQNIFVLLECFSWEARNKKSWREFRLIWHVTILVLWKTRDGRIFINFTKVVVEIFDEIKGVSWRWSLMRLKETSPYFMSGAGIPVIAA